MRRPMKEYWDLVEAERYRRYVRSETRRLLYANTGINVTDWKILEAHREEEEVVINKTNKFVKGKGKGMQTGKEEEVKTRLSYSQILVGATQDQSSSSGWQVAPKKKGAWRGSRSKKFPE